MAGHIRYHYMRPKKRVFPYRTALAIVGAILFLPAAIGLFTNSGNEPMESSATQNSEIENTENQNLAQIEEDKRNSILNGIILPEVAQSAIGTLELGTIKVSENEHPAPIASIAKVITSLVVLEKRPLELGEKGDTITLTLQDEQYFHDYLALDGTLAPVTAGLEISQYEVLQAILLASANNMADTLVDRYFSSHDEYLAFANDFLAQKGLLNTHVADTTGFSPDTISTPSDLIKLGQLALQNPVIKEIVAQPRATIAIAGEIPNYNPFGEYPNVIGIKPGATDEAGYTLLFAAELPKSSGGTEIIIGTVLGHSDRSLYLQSATTIIEQSRQLLIQQPPM